MSNKILVGFLAGAAAGTLAGILLAPDKGSATRQKISDKACDLTDSVKSSLNRFTDSVKNVYRGAKNKAENMADAASDTMSSASRGSYSS